MPINTKLTLKKIVENLNQIPSNETGFGDAPKKLTSEQKKQLMEMASKFEKYAEMFKQEEKILEASKYMGSLCELAKTYALNECSDIFQTEIVKKDFVNLDKRIQEHTKLAKECYAKMQQLNVGVDDVSHILSRYYNLEELAEAFDTSHIDGPKSVHPIMEENESNFKPCGKCGKSLYKGEKCEVCK